MRRWSAAGRLIALFAATESLPNCANRQRFPPTEYPNPRLTFDQAPATPSEIWLTVPTKKRTEPSSLTRSAALAPPLTAPGNDVATLDGAAFMPFTDGTNCEQSTTTVPGVVASMSA